MTVNIHVGYGEVGGYPDVFNPGESSATRSTNISYAQLSSALSSLGAPGSSGLAATSPYAGALTLTSAEAKALGLAAANGTGIDGYMGFTAPLFTKVFYDPTHSLAVPAGYIDFMGVFEHETSEVMGRISSLTSSNNAYSPLDLFRYSSTGVLQTGTGGPAYFSTSGTVDSGSYAFNTTSGADLGDWADSTGVDAFAAYATNGATMALSQTDLQLMQALGWTNSGYQSDSQINLPVAVSGAMAAYQGGSTTAAAIVDSAANVQAALDTLATMAAHNALASITLSDTGSPTLTVTATQLASDAAAIKLITTGYKLAVTSVAAADAASTDAQAGSLAGIAISNNYNSLSLSISDSAVNVMANLTALEALRWDLGSITLTESNATLTMTESTYIAAQQALRTLTNGSVTITGVAAADISSLSPPAHATIEVSDNAANVAAHLGDISNQLWYSTIHITLTDPGTPTLSLTGTQWDSYKPVIESIQGSFKLAFIDAKIVDLSGMTSSGSIASIAISDSAANVSLALDTLENLATSHVLTGITLTDPGTPVLTLTAAQQAADAAALALISGSYTVASPPMTVAAALAAVVANPAGSVSIADTASEISTYLDALQGLLTAGKLVSISIDQPGVIELTEAQLASDAGVMSALSGNFAVAVNEVKLADWATLTAAHPNWSFSVSDTAANIGTNLDQVKALMDAHKLSGATITDTQGIMTLSEATLERDGSIIPWLWGSYTITMSDAISTTELNQLLTDGRFGHTAIADTGAAVTANFDLLEGFSNGHSSSLSEISGITVTDGGNIAIDFQHYQGGTLFLSQIQGAHTLSVRAVPVSNLAAMLNGGTVAFAAIADRASEISAHLDTLQADIAAGKVTGITLTDGGTPGLTVTAAQLTSDAQAISDISGSYTLAVTGGSSVSQLTPALLSHIQSLGISDSAANIAADLDTLQTLASAGKLTAVAVTGSSYTNLTVTPAQLTGDAAVLKQITGNYVLDITASATGATITGLPGHGDIVSYSNNATAYTITTGANGAVMVTGAGGTDHLSGINAIQFGSQTDIVAPTPLSGGAANEGNLTELYGAVFARTPDVPGLGFYEAFLASHPTTSLLQFATYFLGSPEYQNNPAHNYAQTNAGETQFVTDSYQNLLRRTPSASEVSFYMTNVIQPALSGLTAGTAAYATADTQAHALLLVYFSASSEFLGDVSITAQNPSSAQHWLLLTN